MAIFFSSTSASSSLTRGVKAGRLRKIASKLYTDDLVSPVEEVVLKHRLEIVAYFYPGAVISHRSALEGNVSPRGKFHITLPGAAEPIRKLPGLEIRIWPGPGPQSEDARIPLLDGKELFTASQQRALLENLQVARARGNDEPKTLLAAELESWIDRYLKIFGAGWLEDVRKKAQDTASALGWAREMQILNSLIDAINGKISDYKPVTEFIRSRAKGQPFDRERLELFSKLQARLAVEQFQELPKPSSAERENRAFWEAYFSNFIEGTKFTVEEARLIVSDQPVGKAIEHKRPLDAHDVRETYRLIIDPNISDEIPKDPPGLIELLKRRHARMMASRLVIRPGQFKTTNNEFGARVFVAPDLVEETLKRGWPASRELSSAAARALYVLFLVSEVHPFIDGNGRVSRLAMNAELEAANQARFVLPTSLRGDYLSVLEALTTKGNAEPFIKFGHKLIDMNSRMPFTDFETSHQYFRQSGALDEQPQGIAFFTGMDSLK